MASKYYTAAKTNVSNTRQLNEADEKKVKSLEAKINLASDAANQAIKAINNAKKKNELKDYEVIVERAQVEADLTREIGELESQIREIFPAWTSTAREAIAMAMEISSQKIEGAAQTSGLTVGEVLATPVSAISKFWSGLKTASTKRI